MVNMGILIMISSYSSNQVYSQVELFDGTSHVQSTENVCEVYIMKGSGEWLRYSR